MPRLFVALVIVSVSSVLALVVIWLLLLGTASREVPSPTAFMPSISASAEGPGSSTASHAAVAAWVTFRHVLLL